MSDPARSYTGDPEVDRLLFSWPRVIASASGWSRGFALDIQRDRKRHGWMPSARQLATMRRLVADLPITAADDQDDVLLIEAEP